MEVLPSSDVQYVGELDCAQQHPGTALISERELNGFDHEKPDQLPDGHVGDLLPSAQGHQIVRGSKGQRFVDEFPISEGQTGPSCSNSQLEGQQMSGDSHDLDDDSMCVENYCTEPCIASEDASITVDTIENEPNNHGDADSYLPEPNWLHHDEPVALWVKWRGKWQAGIRCARADWPLSTLKGKPTHDRKKYFVVFFPNTKNYSWADMQLVRLINDLPHPIAYRNHKIGLKMVKDLTVARRFIMKKLAVGILNILDQFHAEALIDTARDAKVWKEYAMEVSQCRCYLDLGRMLLKLQSMMLKYYINSEWLQNSHQSWVQQCQVSQSAESIELLKEELFDSILWNKVNSLRDAPVQSTLGSEWKTWKHEAMKLFLTSHPIPNGGTFEQQRCNSNSTMSFECSRKRPKLEVRRAEAHSSQVEKSSPIQSMTVEIGSEFLTNGEAINASMLSSELPRGGDFINGDEPKELPSTVADRWAQIVVEAANSEPVQAKDVEMTPVDENVTKKMIDHGRNRQCIAFIESKGRQCVRWANDGDVYCCVHLASRFTASSVGAKASPPVHTQPCEGTTVLGTRCKHRSLPGSRFCKKHRPRLDKGNTNSPYHTPKRNHEEIIPGAELAYCKDVSSQEAGTRLRVDPTVVMDGDNFRGKNGLIGKLEHSNQSSDGMEMVHCIGASALGSNVLCPESPKHYALYCEQHIPSWLKRARNGRSRILSKEVFTDLLKDCYALEQKLHLHKACELFYKLFKSVLSLRNPVPMDIQLDWALSEASQNFSVGALLLKLACKERERLQNIWGFTANEVVHVGSSVVQESVVFPPVDGIQDGGNLIKCKICLEEFLNDQELGNHFMDSHKKEAQWLFRGYVCAICLDSFTNKKVLETHVQERHHVPFVEHCMLLQCIPCHSHFGSSEQLWLHVLSTHPVEFRVAKAVGLQNLSMDKEKEDSVQKLELGNAVVNNNSEKMDSMRKFACKFCGMKFDLLPDLGRHHQAAHMGPSLASSRPQKKGIRYHVYRLKSGRLTRPRFKKGLGGATFKIKNRGSAILKKHTQISKLPRTNELSVQPHLSQASSLGKLAESQCSEVAKKLFGEIKKTKPRPSNLDILAIARTVCCSVSLKASLQGKYGVLPERLFLKAAKLCSEHSIQVEWHQEGFVCPRGCKSFKDPGFFSPMMPRPVGYTAGQVSPSPDSVNKNWDVDEGHYVIDLHEIRGIPLRKATILCDDISFGREQMPVTCVIYEDLLDSFQVNADGSGCQVPKVPMPWESFTYVTSPLPSESPISFIENLHLGCSCLPLSCCAESCDHVYLFDHDYEDAKDIYGNPMRGRFPYDDKGRILLEEGYLVYECNDKCNCNKTCPNRVLQNGVRVKLEIFKTENKGWAVRAGEPILRGMFVCEYIGEVLGQEEATQRHDRYGGKGCSYMFTIDSQTNDMSRLIEGQGHYVIDATKFGNVSRFINHSCLPNLLSHQVLVDSMDPQRAHIGLYASRDIAFGEELTFNYRYELLSGEGCPCHCGSSKCRGRLC